MKYPVTISNYQLVRNSADNSAEIYIDGSIVDAETQEFFKNYFGDETSVSYKSFRNELLNCGTKNVKVYCNGPGGHVGDAMAMHDMIVDLNTNKGWNIDTFGRGIVASSLTYIVMAGKNGGEVSQNTSWLIHNVSGGVRGNVTEIENYAKTLRKFNNMIVDFYANVTGMSKTVIGNMMDAETWIMGGDIKNQGFVKTCGGIADFTNTISPEQWPFSNMAVLNTYNSSVSNKITDMDIKALGDKIVNAVKLAMGNTTQTADQRDAAITNALTEGFKEIDTAVNNSVTAAMNSEATVTAVTNAITEALKTIPANFTQAITDATSGFATTAQLETLQNDLANKLGGQNSGKPGNVTEPEGIENKAGWNWNGGE